MARGPQLPASAQTALQGLDMALSTGMFFLAVCLCSAATSKSAAILLTALVLSVAFLFWGRLRDRMKAPMLALALVVLVDGLSCGWAASGPYQSAGAGPRLGGIDGWDQLRLCGVGQVRPV